MKQIAVTRTKWQQRAEWTSLRQWYRREVGRVLADIERGQVDEQDLAKLHNYCMVSLALLAKVEERTWRAAERDAELAALITGEVEDRFGEEHD